MRNQYFIEGDTVRIVLKRKTGDPLIAIADLADLPKLQAFDTSWYGWWNRTSKKFYAHAHHPDTDIPVPMHRFLMDFPEGLEVDHIEHDGLDNRRSNLRAVTRSINQLNRKGPESRNTHGHRGVSFCPGKRGRKPWRVRFVINGRQRYFGRYITAEEAGAAAKVVLGRIISGEIT